MVSTTNRPFCRASWVVGLCAALSLAAVACGDEGGGPAADTVTAADTADTGGADTAPVEDTAEPDDTAADSAVDTADDDGGDADDAADGDEADGAEVDAAAPFCGDGHRDPDEGCDDGAANSDTEPDACRTSCEVAHCGDGVTDAGEACDDGNLRNLDGCTTACTFGAIVAHPAAAGAVVVSELMVDPDAVNDVHGEWIELTNPGAVALDLDGCELRDDGTDRAAIAAGPAGLVIQPGGRVVVGPDTATGQNGGAPVTLRVTGMLLDNQGDEVELVCDGVVIDRVAYDAAHWPLISGRALSLDPSRQTAAADDLAESWCPAVTAYGKGDQGTPGAPNPTCFQLDTVVDACVLTAPAALAGFTGAPVSVTVEVAERGVTDLTRGVDESPNLRVEVGYGPLGAAPDAGGWTFVAAGAAPGWVGGADNRDGYVGGLVFDATGSFAVAARASRDRGATWTYCDRGAGAADGFDLADASVATVAATPCTAGSCVTPPESTCDLDGVTANGFAAVGRCTPVDATHVSCDYDALSEDCSRAGSACEDGACGGVAATPALEGDVVISEIMLDPTQVTRARGQWVELVVPGEEPLDLGGCELVLTTYGAGFTPREAAATLAGPLVVPAGGIRVVAGALTDNGGIDAAAAWGAAFVLPTAQLDLAVRCDGVVIDHVAYTPESFPHALGKAVSLSPYAVDGAANDAATAWCAAATAYGTGDRGTPGAPNPPCAGDEVTPTQCRLVELVSSQNVGAGTALDVKLRLVAAPVTSVSSRTDPNDAVLVEVGFAPAGTAASAEGAWTWMAAEPDLSWIATSATGLGLAEDRYVLRGTAPEPGAWAIVARVTADGGHTRYVCDTQSVVGPAGVAAPLTLTTVASACAPDPCTSPPGLTCAVAAGAPSSAPLTVVTDLQAPARCTLDLDGAPLCAWRAEPVEDCAEVGALCEDAACAHFPVAPAPGDVVVTELMVVPSSSELGEWIELTNASPEPVDLAGCELRSGVAEAWAFPEPVVPTDVVIAPGAAVVIARSQYSSINGGVAPRWVQT
ncbi:MAG: lamin tail domain-containing protein, partial [Myxococcales bacterium]|nr:lamin tail domain-containing protein [Myxococcales bacterium]